MDVTWNQTDLELWLMMDTWDADTAFDVLSGFNPDFPEMPPDNGIEYPDTKVTCLFVWPIYRDESDFTWSNPKHELFSIFNHAYNFRNKLEKLWSYSEYIIEDLDCRDTLGYPAHRPPKFYIDYFSKKGLIPVWLDWAKEVGIYTQLSDDVQTEDKSTKDIPTYFPEDKHPLELDYAINAYHYAVEKIEQGSNYSPQVLIEDYLRDSTQQESDKKKNYCSEKGIERIKVVANWLKAGGVKKL